MHVCEKYHSTESRIFNYANFAASRVAQRKFGFGTENVLGCECYRIRKREILGHH